jgi:hypothetical protein
MRLIYLSGLLLLAPIQSAVAEISWYLGGGGAITKIETIDFVGISGVGTGLPPSTTVTTGDFSDSPLGWQLFVGVMFSENFGFSVKYSDSGKGKDQWTGTSTFQPAGQPPPNPIVTNLSFDGESEMDGFTIYALQTIPFAEKFEFTFEGGFTRQDVKFAWNSTGSSGSMSDDAFGFAVGGILRYKFLKHFAMSGEVEYLNVDFSDRFKKPLRFGANIEFHF